MEPDELLKQSDFVRSLARSLVLDAHRADDVEQDTWLAAFKDPPVIRKSLRSWFSGVIRNLVHVGIRRDSRRIKHEKAAADSGTYLSPEEIAIREESVQLMSEAVFKLGEPFRTTVLLRFYDGLSIHEIAKRTGSPVGTVKSRLNR